MGISHTSILLCASSKEELKEALRNTEYDELLEFLDM